MSEEHGRAGVAREAEERAARAFPGDAVSVSAARRFVSAAVPLSPEAEVMAEQLVSELATNAMLHAGGGFTVIVVRAGAVVRVEVEDESSAMPVRKDYGPLAPTGRGLHIIDACATRWGATRLERGKSVWFELADPLAVILG